VNVSVVADRRAVPSDADDFFSGIDIDNEKAFSFGKPALNPNIKCGHDQTSAGYEFVEIPSHW
jgi:hypothetical protein